MAWRPYGNATYVAAFPGIEIVGARANRHLIEVNQARFPSFMTDTNGARRLAIRDLSRLLVSGKDSAVRSFSLSEKRSSRGVWKDRLKDSLQLDDLRGGFVIGDDVTANAYWDYSIKRALVERTYLCMIGYACQPPSTVLGTIGRRCTVMGVVLANFEELMTAEAVKSGVRFFKWRQSSSRSNLVE